MTFQWGSCDAQSYCWNRFVPSLPGSRRNEEVAAPLGLESNQVVALTGYGRGIGQSRASLTQI